LNHIRGFLGAERADVDLIYRSHSKPGWLGRPRAEPLEVAVKGTALKGTLFRIPETIVVEHFPK